MKTKRTNF